MSSRLRASLAILVVVALGGTLIGFAVLSGTGKPAAAPTTTPSPSKTPSPSQTRTIDDSTHPACVQSASAIRDLITSIGGIATAPAADLVSGLTKERTNIAAGAAQNASDPAASSINAVANAITAILDQQKRDPKGDFSPSVAKVTNALSNSTDACAS